MYPHAAIEAVRRIRANTPKEELRKWGLRMQARHGGLAVQALYRLRGEHPFSAEARAKRKAKAEEEKHKTRRKILDSGWL